MAVPSPPDSLPAAGRSGPALAAQLHQAARVLAAVARGRSATAALDPVPAALRPGVQALSHHALRHWGEAQALRALLASRPPPPAADALLCLGLALMTERDRPLYPAHTLVDQAVTAARLSPDTRAQAPFVNACLRRALREWPDLQHRARQDVLARWNHPRWWVQRLQRDHPQHWEALLDAAQRPPPMTLRVNSRWGSVADYQRRLTGLGRASVAVGPQALELLEPCAVGLLPGFAEGHVSVQDASAQQAARLLLGVDDAQPPDTRGWRVLDACAAPGGKTGHLLELADAEVLALDVDPVRCTRIRDTLQRLSGCTPTAQATVRAADAAQPRQWWDGQPFDAILLDAPCTASGIGRRHPDVRWLRRPQDIDQLARQQAELLTALWPLLRPGGRLLYCTCSVFRAEGQQQIESFLVRNTDAHLLPSPGHLLPAVAGGAGGVAENQPQNGDGFYYALLARRPG